MVIAVGHNRTGHHTFKAVAGVQGYTGSVCGTGHLHRYSHRVEAPNLLGRQLPVRRSTGERAASGASAETCAFSQLTLPIPIHVHKNLMVIDLWVVKVPDTDAFADV
jgi:hypothetical protein